jgi:hypothetical protein
VNEKQGTLRRIIMIYDVEVSAIITVEADNEADAINKAQEKVSDELDILNLYFEINNTYEHQPNETPEN